MIHEVSRRASPDQISLEADLNQSIKRTRTEEEEGWVAAALNFNRANGKHFQELAASLVKPIDLVTNHPSPPSRLESPKSGRRANTLFSRRVRTFPSLFSPLSFFLPFSSSLVARFFAAKALNRATIKTAPVASSRRTAIFRCRNVENEFMATVAQPGHCELKLASRQMDERKKRVVAIFSRL